MECDQQVAGCSCHAVLATQILILTLVLALLLAKVQSERAWPLPQTQTSCPPFTLNAVFEPHLHPPSPSPCPPLSIPAPANPKPISLPCPEHPQGHQVHPGPEAPP